jgi:hypothetical protein
MPEEKLIGPVDVVRGDNGQTHCLGWELATPPGDGGFLLGH